MSGMADCCGICCICCTCFSVCGRCCLYIPIPFKSKTKREDEELAAQIEQEMRAEALHNPEQQFPQYGSYPMRPPEARFNDRWAMGPEPTRLPERPDSSQAPPYGTAR